MGENNKTLSLEKGSDCVTGGETEGERERRGGDGRRERERWQPMSGRFTGGKAYFFEYDSNSLGLRETKEEAGGEIQSSGHENIDFVPGARWTKNETYNRERKKNTTDHLCRLRPGCGGDGISVLFFLSRGDPSCRLYVHLTVLAQACENK